MSNNEKRQNPRFEPPFVDAEIKINSRTTVQGRVLDASKSGMAIAISDIISPEDIGSVADISVRDGLKSDSVKREVGRAKIVRRWPGSQGNVTNGLALKFDNELPTGDVQACLLTGPDKITRLNSQAQLYQIDTEYLGDYRRDLISCQVKLFALALTLGVTLAGAYFGLSYHSAISVYSGRADLSFWRTMVAALPGLLAVASAMMVVQKSISIQRIDAYLLVLKRNIIENKFPREYRGWESAYRKLKHFLNSSKCKNCTIARRRVCGSWKDSDKREIESVSLIRSFSTDLFHIVMYLTFFAIMVLSVVAVLRELFQYQIDNTGYIVIGASLVIVIALPILVLLITIVRLRKGKLSIVHFKRCWNDILVNCRYPA